MPGPYYRRRWYQRRYAADGTDLELAPSKIAALSRSAAPEWQPHHPETSPSWLSWRLLIEGISKADLETMSVDEQADALEALQVTADVNMWQHAQLRGQDE